MQRFLDSNGYYISNEGFKGPFLSVKDIQSRTHIPLTSISIFCVKKVLRDGVAGVLGRQPPAPWRRRLVGTGVEDVWGRWLEAAAAGKGLL